MVDPLRLDPMLEPFVGFNSQAGGDKSVLLIGESHYLPTESAQHRTAER